jgi:predicted kinase
MAQDYAKPFYRSKRWRKCRDGYFAKAGGICELCGKPGEEVHHKTFLTPTNINDPNITLNWDNLQLLCKSCHFAIHDMAYVLYRAKHKRNRGIRNDLEFNEDGEVVERKNVFIVWGAPASGKSKYVADNKGRHDLVVDLDLLVAALSGGQGQRSDDAFKYALDVRDYLYRLIEERKHYFDAAWIIATLPEKQKREELSRRLRAELVHIDTPRERCIEQARKDETRKNKELQYRIIDKYFRRLEV